MTILGVTASSILKVSGVWDSLQTTTISGTSTASLTFSSIPSTYTHLAIRVWGYDLQGYNTYVRFNGNSSALYTTRTWYWNQGASSFQTVVNSATQFELETRWGYTGNQFSSNMIEINNYANTSYTKSIFVQGSNSNSTSATSWTGWAGGVWNNTAAISSITLYTLAGYLQAGTKFMLYGIK